VHSNGFSLIRALELDWRKPVSGEPGAGVGAAETLGEALLRPTRLYVGPVLSLLGEVAVHGMAHITGGGMPENLPRMAPRALRYEIDRASLPRLPVFDRIAEAGVTDEEMLRTFNMGVGMVLAVAPADAGRALSALETAGVEALEIGRVLEGEGVCIE
jgi:phosphoribosylformylglycinamidine cyclo-ligase